MLTCSSAHIVLKTALKKGDNSMVSLEFVWIRNYPPVQLRHINTVVLNLFIIWKVLENDFMLTKAILIMQARLFSSARSHNIEKHTKHLPIWYLSDFSYEIFLKNRKTAFSKAKPRLFWNHAKYTPRIKKILTCISLQNLQDIATNGSAFSSEKKRALLLKTLFSISNWMPQKQCLRIRKTSCPILPSSAETSITANTLCFLRKKQGLLLLNTEKQLWNKQIKTPEREHPFPKGKGCSLSGR